MNTERRLRKHRNESKRKIHKWRDERWKMLKNCQDESRLMSVITHWKYLQSVGDRILMLKWDGFKRLKLSVPFAFSNNLSREISFCIYKSKTSNLFSQKIHFLPESISHIKKKPHKSGMINKFCRRRICGNKWWSSEWAYWECQVFV